MDLPFIGPGFNVDIPIPANEFFFFNLFVTPEVIDTLEKLTDMRSHILTPIRKI